MLEVRQVTAGYSGTVVLHGVSLVVPPSSVVALLGPNGAGKTTLLRVVSGSIRPDAGAVLLDGADLTSLAPHRRVSRGLCHIPEGRGVFPNLSVEENLVLHSSAGTEAESLERAVTAFPRLGERRRQLAGTLSGGEQQMLALARAYVQRPSVVLLDEVSMGLAPRIVDEIFEFLSRLAADGASLLLVEQYVTRAMAVADLVYLLNGGRVAFVGEPGELQGDELFRHYVSGDLGEDLEVAE